MKNFNEYIDDRIENMIMSKITNRRQTAKYYFSNRHKGLHGIDNEQVVGLCLKEIRDYRVWKEMWVRNEFYKQVRKV